MIHIRVEGHVEFIGDDGSIVSVASSQTQQAIYLAWCREQGVEPMPSLAIDLG